MSDANSVDHSPKSESLTKLGFRFGRNGVHSARTMMFDEVSELFQKLPPDASRDDYAREIIEFNILGKKTMKSRELTCRHLTELYTLDTSMPVFRAFRKFWDIESDARPLLALTISLARDPLLRQSQQFILPKHVGDGVGRIEHEEFIEKNNPDRYSAASLQSIAQNINGTWTRAGYLHGRNKKNRSIPVVSPVNVAFCLFLAYLEGLSGQRLFNSTWIELLQRSREELVQLSTSAANRGLLVFMNAGGVMEVRFPGYLTSEEEKILNEQN